MVELGHSRSQTLVEAAVTFWLGIHKRQTGPQEVACANRLPSRAQPLQQHAHYTKALPSGSGNSTRKLLPSFIPEALAAARASGLVWTLV